MTRNTENIMKKAEQMSRARDESEVTPEVGEFSDPMLDCLFSPASAEWVKANEAAIIGSMVELREAIDRGEPPEVLRAIFDRVVALP
jgi:hypothetical protein